EPHEIEAGTTIALRDRRARHLRDVVRPSVGSRLRAGVVRGPVGDAEVISLTPEEIVVRFEARGPAPAPIAVDLVVAVPRPKVLRRVLHAAAAIGVRRIDLVNAWRVEKSYLGSARLAAESTAFDVRIGAEQGGTTWVPDVVVHPRLMRYL